jgi:hypothetical protein
LIEEHFANPFPSHQARIQCGEDDGLSEEPELTYSFCCTQQRERHCGYHGDRTR